MRNDKRRRAFAAQFRDEEGLLVFRYRQRGVPVEVSPAERDRAIAQFVSFERIARRVAVSALVIGVFAVLHFMPPGTGSIPLAIGAYLSLALASALMLRSAWNQPTRAWRGRPAVGERLGRVGAWLMRLEQASWRDLMFGAGSATYLLFLSFRYSVGPAWFRPTLLALCLFLLATIVIKVGLGERARLRRRRLGDMRAHRDLHLR